MGEAETLPLGSAPEGDAASASRKLLMSARPERVQVPESHAPLAAPEIISNSEQAVSTLQDTIVAYARVLRERARAQNVNHRDMQVTATLATAAAKLAAEQREQATQMQLSLQSDEDIVRLVVDSVRALGHRGKKILTTALSLLDP